MASNKKFIVDQFYRNPQSGIWFSMWDSRAYIKGAFGNIALADCVMTSDYEDGKFHLFDVTNDSSIKKLNKKIKFSF
jgi:hypothetical protein